VVGDIVRSRLGQHAKGAVAPLTILEDLQVIEDRIAQLTCMGDQAGFMASPPAVDAAGLPDLGCGDAEPPTIRRLG
jgi:hypothetical protein